MLSSLIHIPGVTAISDHPLVIRLLKGIHNVRPPKPKYEFIWDTDLVMQYLKTLVNSEVDFRMLSLKTVTLLTLLSGQRVSTIHHFRVSELQRTPALLIFNVKGLLKHSRPNHPTRPVSFHAFPYDAQLCPVALVESYLSARSQLPGADKHDEFILCFRKPHGPATTDTLARWVKTVLSLSGVNLFDSFTAHSCRSASTSKAKLHGVALLEILKAGQWSKESTFFQFYAKDIMVSETLTDGTFSTSLLT